MQNIEKSSSGLVTISQRLRGIEDGSDEAGVSVAKLGKDFKDIAGIDILDKQTGQLRSTYDILDDLAEVYPSLSKNNRQYLMELAAGKRQVNVLQSIMQNWESVENATKNASNATGSANKEQEVYLNSIKGKLSQLQSAFQQMSVNTIDSGAIKGFVDLLTTIVKLIDQVGLLNIAFTALFVTMNHKSGGAMSKGIMDFFTTIVKKKPDLKGFASSINALPSAFNKTKTAAAGTTTAVATIGTSAKGASAGVATLIGSIKAFLLTAAPLLAVIIAVQAVFSGLSHVIDENSDFQEKYAEKVQSTTEKVTDLKSEYEELSKKTNKTDAEETKLKLLKQELDIQEQLLKIQKEREFDSKFNGDVGRWTGFWNSLTNTSGYNESKEKHDKATPENYSREADYKESMGEGTEAIRLRTKAIEEYHLRNTELEAQQLSLNVVEKDSAQIIKDKTEGLLQNNEGLQQQQLSLNRTVEESAEIFESNAEEISKNNEEIVKAHNANLDLINALQQRKDAGYQLTEAEQQALDVAQDSLDKTNEIISANQTMAETLDSIPVATENISLTFDSMTKSLELVSTAIQDMDSNGQLSIDTVMQMISSGEDFIDLMYLENGVYKLSEDAVGKLFATKRNSAIAEMQIQKATLQGTVDGIQAQVNAYKSGSTASAESAKTSGNNIISIANTVANATKGMIASLGGVMTSAMYKAEDAYNAAKNAVGAITSKDEFKRAEAELKEARKGIAHYDEAINFLTNTTAEQFAGTADTVNDKIKDQAKSAKNTAKVVDEEYNRALKENEKLQKALEKQIKATNDAISAEKDAFDDKENAYNVFLKETLKILEKEINVLNEQKDAREAFYDAEIQAIKDKITLLDETADKEDELNKIEEARLEIIKRQQALEDIRKNKNVKKYVEGKGWTWDIDEESEKNALDSVKEAEKAFVELQKKWNLAQQKLDLEGQIKALEDAKDKNIKNIEEQIEALEDFKDQWSESMDIQEDISKYEGMIEALQKFENGSFETRKGMLYAFTNAWKSESEKHNEVIDGLTIKLDELQRKADEVKEQADIMKEHAQEAKDALDATKDSANNASDAIGRFNSTQYQVKKSPTGSQIISRDGKLYQITAYSDGSSEEKYLGIDANAIKSAISNLPFAGKKHAKGGVIDNGGSDEILDYTGIYHKNPSHWVDGSTSKPEVVVSNDSASWLHDMLTARQLPLSMQQVSNSNSSIGDTFMVDKVVVQADSQSTVESIFQQAYNLSKHKK